MKYEHKEETHNLRSPQVIVPFLYKFIHPKSVIDIGCGVGTFLYAFKKLGVNEVMGLDGDWVNKQLMSKYLEPNEFKPINLSEFEDVKKKYELAICLEVAEHIGERFSDNLIKTIVHASDVIIFSAASPYQQGQHHINEQWPDYWIRKFSKHDFHFYDVLRSTLWNNPDVDFWYKQNIFLVMHKDHLFDEQWINDLKKNTFNNLIHPDAFIKRSKLLVRIIDGKMNTYFYLKLLVKNFLNKIGMYKKSKIICKSLR